MNKRVLIITYYWPPSGGSGVQRWLKFVKYLPQFGCEPYVFTPENPSFEIKDESLLKSIPIEAEIIKLPIWEPYRIFNKLNSYGTVGAKSSVPVDAISPDKRTTFQRISGWIRANLFIPDPRIFWIRPSVMFLHDFIIDKRITTIITTGPPHSMHLIGLKLKQKNHALHWIADFRDPWTEWGLWEKLGVGPWAMKRHKQLELKVLTSADVIVSVTPHYVRRFKQLSGKDAVLLTNGFDEDDFQEINYSKNEKFIIRHIGIVNEQRDPIPVMEAFRQLVEEHEEFRDYVQIEFVGEVYQPFKDYIATLPLLSKFVSFTGNVSHAKVVEFYGSTSLLLLILTGYRDPHGFFPGKLFEYVATGLPILGIGPVVSDAATVLQQAGVGIMNESDDISGIKATLLKYFKEWKSNPDPIVKRGNISAYSRKAITSQLIPYLK